MWQPGHISKCIGHMNPFKAVVLLPQSTAVRRSPKAPLLWTDMDKSLTQRHFKIQSNLSRTCWFMSNWQDTIGNFPSKHWHSQKGSSSLEMPTSVCRPQRRGQRSNGISITLLSQLVILHFYFAASVRIQAVGDKIKVSDWPLSSVQPDPLLRLTALIGVVTNSSVEHTLVSTLGTDEVVSARSLQTDSLNFRESVWSDRLALRCFVVGWLINGFQYVCCYRQQIPREDQNQDGWSIWE